MREPPLRNKREGERRRSKRGKRRERSDSSRDTGRSVRRRRKQASINDRGETRCRAASSSSSSSSSENDNETAKACSDRKFCRGKPHQHDDGNARAKITVATRSRKGTPPLKMGKSSLFDSTSSESSSAEAANSSKTVVSSKRKKTKPTKRVETSAGCDTTQSSITSCSPCLGRYYRDDLSCHIDWDDARYEEEKRKIHDERHEHMDEMKKSVVNFLFTS